jgi:phosphatidylglycerol:prolipoprotein diacylglycerol transferase
MHPVLFKIGGANIYSFGACLGLAFAAGIILFVITAVKEKIPMYAAFSVLVLTIFSFSAGSKIFYALEIFIAYGEVIPSYIFLSNYGSNFAGGLFLTGIFVFLFSKLTKNSALKILDTLSLPLLLGYIIGRLGCHLSGDGDYGRVINPDSIFYFLGVSYDKGTIPTPPGVFVHPLPVYEMILCSLFLIILWKKKNQFQCDGILYALFLIMYGAERFLTDFISVNPPLFLHLTINQLLSIIFIAAGFYIYKNKDSEYNHKEVLQN